MGTKNVYDDGAVVPGAGAFEMMLYGKLMEYKITVKGKVKLGIEAFANAMLAIPKGKKPYGVDLNSGEPVLPGDIGVYDNHCVKRQMLHSAPVLASQLLQIDMIMRAGMATVKPQANKD